MKPILYSALAVAIALMFTSTSSTMAQDYSSAYKFGLGFNYGTNGNLVNNCDNGRNFFGGRFGVNQRMEQPPYFAKFPPVYYNGIVSRPYGISPYAAPPGIAPVEMSAVKPVTINNPFFNQQVETVAKEKVETKEKTKHKTTWVKNPYADASGSVVGR